MSKFTKCALAGAIAMAFSGVALAGANVTTVNGSFAHEVTGGPLAAATTSPLADASTVSFNVTAPNILIGRADATGQVTVSATIVGAQILSAPVAADLTLQGTLQGSVTSGTNSFQFVILPPTVAAGGFSSATPIFTLNALHLKNANGLKALGGQVTIEVVVQDTTTGTELSRATVQPVLTSVQATTTTNTGAAATTIDVMNPSLKTKFLGANATFTTLGTAAVGLANVGTVAAPAVASAAGTAAAGNVNAGLFQFDAGTDELVLTLNVPSAGAFDAFYAIDSGTACAATVPGAGVEFDPVVGSTTGFTATVPVTAATGATYNICAIVDGTTKIDAQTISLTSQIDLADALTVNPPARVTEAFHVLRYNGSVAKVDHFNPASNVNQISYLRIINPSTASGLVHVEGVCDDGTAQASVNLNLDAGKALLLTAADLANGAKGLSGAFTQCATGKSRLTVTGEFAGMRVQNFLRNVTADGTQINTNVNTNDMSTSGL